MIILPNVPNYTTAIQHLVSKILNDLFEIMQFFIHLGNYSFVGVLGSVEPSWSCETHNGTTMIIDAPTDSAKCAFIKSNCTHLTPIKSSVEFHSLVAAWKLICDDKNKPNIIQLAQAAGGVINNLFILHTVVSLFSSFQLRGQVGPFLRKGTAILRESAMKIGRFE